MELWEQAYEDYSKGMKYKEIADKYGVTVNTVKSWKTRHWNNKKCAHKSKKGVHTKSKKVCTQKGAPKGNKNAVGNGAPERNKNARKHGIYEKYSRDSYDEETLEMVENMPDDDEFLLLKTIESFVARERHILHIIMEHKEKPGGLAIAHVTTTKNEYDCDKGKKKKGKYHTTTTTATESTNSVVWRWENELTRVQRAKAQCIRELSKLRLEKRKADESEKGVEDLSPLAELLK